MPVEIHEFTIFDVKAAADSRGSFTKLITGNDDVLPGLDIRWSECFFTTSSKATIRGMHYQTSPHDHAKIVYCLSGEIIDVALDLRPETLGEVWTARLSDANGKAVYIPVGYAHGFQVLSETATVLYLQTSSHSPAHDTGIEALSFGFEWPLGVGERSARDLALPAFDGQRSYFCQQS